MGSHNQAADNPTRFVASHRVGSPARLSNDGLHAMGGFVMKEIPLTQGKVALVDDGDYERVMAHKWHVLRHSRCQYALTDKLSASGRPSSESMHRFVLGAGAGVCVDHKDGNGLNNQRSNLRICTTAENSRNQHHKQGGTSSQYRGVYQRKDYAKWCARIGVAGKRIFLGDFDCESAAARAYNEAALRYFGEFACPNEITE